MKESVILGSFPISINILSAWDLLWSSSFGSARSVHNGDPVISNMRPFVSPVITFIHSSQRGAVPESIATFNSLTPARCGNNFKNAFSVLIYRIVACALAVKLLLRVNFTEPKKNVKSTLVQVMAWCRQATSHYLEQCCPRSMSLYGVTKPQWVYKLVFIASTVPPGNKRQLSHVSPVNFDIRNLGALAFTVPHYAYIGVNG